MTQRKKPAKRFQLHFLLATQVLLQMQNCLSHSLSAFKQTWHCKQTEKREGMSIKFHQLTVNTGWKKKENGLGVGGGGGLRYALCRHWHGAWKKMSEGTDMQGTPPPDLSAQSCLHGHLCVGCRSVFVDMSTWDREFSDRSSSQHVRDYKMMLMEQELPGCLPSKLKQYSRNEWYLPQNPERPHC